VRDSARHADLKGPTASEVFTNGWFPEKQAAASKVLYG